MMKLTDKLRSGIISKDWRFSPGEQLRQPQTFQEVAAAVGFYLEERADIYATNHANRDSFASLGESGQAGRTSWPSINTSLNNVKNRSYDKNGAAIACGFCGMANDHFTWVCPQKAAKIRGEDGNPPGKSCSICGHAGHQQKHHDHDYQYL